MCIIFKFSGLALRTDGPPLCRPRFSYHKPRGGCHFSWETGRVLGFPDQKKKDHGENGMKVATPQSCIPLHLQLALSAWLSLWLLLSACSYLNGHGLTRSVHILTEQQRELERDGENRGVMALFK